MLSSLMPSLYRSANRSDLDPFSNLRRAMDRTFEDFANDFGDGVSGLWGESVRDFVPKLALVDKEDQIILTAELPGLTDKDVQVEMNDEFLTIKGEKKAEHEAKKSGRYVSERSYGSFERTIRLTNGINRDKIDATVKNGVLTVTIPKSADARKNVKMITVHH